MVHAAGPAEDLQAVAQAEAREVAEAQEAGRQSKVVVPVTEGAAG